MKGCQVWTMARESSDKGAKDGWAPFTMSRIGNNDFSII